MRPSGRARVFSASSPASEGHARLTSEMISSSSSSNQSSKSTRRSGSVIAMSCLDWATLSTRLWHICVGSTPSPMHSASQRWTRLDTLSPLDSPMRSQQELRCGPLHPKRRRALSGPWRSPPELLQGPCGQSLFSISPIRIRSPPRSQKVFLAVNKSVATVLNVRMTSRILGSTSS